MRKSGLKRKIFGRRFFQETAGHLPALPMLSLCFAVGALAGSLVGMFSPAAFGSAVAVEDVESAAGFLSNLVGCFRFPLLAVCCATSLMGVVLIPAAVLLRGYFLSCASAAMISAYGLTGLGLSLCYLGLPALLAVPALFFLALDGMRISGSLLALVRGGGTMGGAGPVLRRAIVCGLALVLSAVVETYLVPALMRAF